MDIPKSIILTSESKLCVADNVNHPSHYTNGKVECIDALESATDGLAGIEAVCTANAIKYLWRWKYKNGIEDLKKAQWYIDRLIKHQEKSQCVTGSHSEVGPHITCEAYDPNINQYTYSGPIPTIGANHGR